MEIKERVIESVTEIYADERLIGIIKRI